VAGVQRRINFIQFDRRALPRACKSARRVINRSDSSRGLRGEITWHATLHDRASTRSRSRCRSVEGVVQHRHAKRYDMNLREATVIRRPFVDDTRLRYRVRRSRTSLSCETRSSFGKKDVAASLDERLAVSSCNRLHFKRRPQAPVIVSR